MTTLTPALAAASFYTALLIIVGIILQARVIALRRAKGIGIGAGEDHALDRAIRVHGNFSENVPIALAGMILLALSATSAWPVHLVGILLLVGRVAHAIGLSKSAGATIERIVGMLLTFGALIVTAVLLMARVVERLLA